MNQNMGAVVEQLSRDATNKNWQNRFQNKWPYITTMMHQSEMTIQPQIHVPEYSEESLDAIYRNPKLPGWQGSSPDLWSDPRSHDILDEDSASGIDSRKSSHRKCEKRCRNALCAFFIFSVTSVTIAAIGLTVFLTQDNRVNSLIDHNYRTGGHIDANLTTDQQDYLSKSFCSLFKLMLRSADFPVDSGLEDCSTLLMLKKDTDSLHLEMNVTPKEGYTLIEKILRALTRRINENVIRISKNGTLERDTNPAKIPGRSITRRIHAKTRTTKPVTSTKSTTTTGGVESTTANTASPERSQDSQSTKQNENAVVLGSINFGFMHSPTIASTQEMSKITRNIPMRSGNIEPKLSTFSRETTAVRRTSVASKVTSTSNDVIAAISTESTIKDVPSEPPLSVETVEVKTLLPEKKSSNNNRAPVATNLFNPAHTSEVKTNLNREEVKPVKSSPENKATESLMAGGVMRFPLKTKSNFRFLLLGKPEVSNDDVTSPDSIRQGPVRPKVHTIDRNRFDAKSRDNVRSRSRSSQTLENRLIDSSRFSKQFLTQPGAKRRLDVTTFG